MPRKRQQRTQVYQMFDRRCGRRFEVRSRVDGSLRVVRDVYLARDDGSTWNALSGEPVAPGEPLMLALNDGGRYRLCRVIVQDVRPLTDGPDMRYELSLQPVPRWRVGARREW